MCNASVDLHFSTNKSKALDSSVVGYIHICVCVCVCVLLSSNQNQRGGDVTGWGGLQNECQFIEAQPHSHNQHVLY